MYSEKKKAQGPWSLPVVTQLITHKAESPLSQAHNLSHPFCIFNVLAMTHPTPHIALNLPYTIHSYHYLEVQFSSHHDAGCFHLLCVSHHLKTFTFLLFCSSWIRMNIRVGRWITALSLLINSRAFLMSPYAHSHTHTVCHSQFLSTR